MRSVSLAATAALPRNSFNHNSSPSIQRTAAVAVGEFHGVFTESFSERLPRALWRSMLHYPVSIKQQLIFKTKCLIHPEFNYMHNTHLHYPRSPGNLRPLFVLYLAHPRRSRTITRTLATPLTSTNIYVVVVVVRHFNTTFVFFKLLCARTQL